jgi:hypothetical protein
MVLSKKEPQKSPDKTTQTPFALQENKRNSQRSKMRPQHRSEEKGEW